MRTDARATTRLRYRFSHLAQARAHLRDSDGRWLLFYREEKLRLLPGAPICLELGFEDGGATRLLHAQVLDCLEGSGTWLEILDPRPLLSTAQYTRADRRLGCDLPVEVRSEARIVAARLLDVSAGGARIIGGVEPFAVDERVELRLLSPDRLTFRDLSFGMIAWTARNELGVRFDPKDTVGHSAIVRLIKEMSARWQSSWEAAHPRFCCTAAGLSEPLPPQLPRPEAITQKAAR